LMSPVWGKECEEARGNSPCVSKQASARVLVPQGLLPV
jgi:hypothetical protein